MISCLIAKYGSGFTSLRVEFLIRLGRALRGAAVPLALLALLGALSGVPGAASFRQHYTSTVYSALRVWSLLFVPIL